MAAPLPERNVRLRLAYDGTGLVGWQRQSRGTSVQGLLEDALARIAGRPVTVTGAGRTDAGVHATGQVASVRLAARLNDDALRQALNAVLPGAVRVLEVTEVDASFHARHSAVSKTYEYRIVDGPVAPPLAARTCWHVPSTLDLEAMRREAASFVGEHDFGAFQSTGSSVASSVRRVFESSIHVWPLTRDSSVALPVPIPVVARGRLLVYRIRGSGFLRHMVRAMVGTLAEVGAGRGSPGRVARLLAGEGGRAAAGATAPAHGLCLVSVEYEASGEVATHR